MEVAIVGAGALGTLFGGALAVAGNDVHLLHHRERAARQIAENGVRVRSEFLDGLPDRIDVHATTDASEVGPVDVAVVLVRAHQTADALDEHAACVGPETRVLSLQNGFRNYDVLEDRVGDRALAGLTYQGADLAEPGVVEHTSVGDTLFGGADVGFARRVRDALESAGFDDVTVTDDPRPHIWEKQIVGSVFKPTAALTRLHNGPLVDSGSLRDVIAGVVAEDEAVAAARGVSIPSDDLVGKITDVGHATATHRSSMLQDVAAERKTEIDEVNGAIVAYADEEGVPVPYNRLLTTLVHGLEQSYLGPDREDRGK